MGPFATRLGDPEAPRARAPESVPLGLPGRDLVGQFLPAGSAGPGPAEPARSAPSPPCSAHWRAGAWSGIPVAAARPRPARRPRTATSGWACSRGPAPPRIVVASGPPSSHRRRLCAAQSAAVRRSVTVTPRRPASGAPARDRFAVPSRVDSSSSRAARPGSAGIGSAPWPRSSWLAASQPTTGRAGSYGSASSSSTSSLFQTNWPSPPLGRHYDHFGHGLSAFFFGARAGGCRPTPTRRLPARPGGRPAASPSRGRGRRGPSSRPGRGPSPHRSRPGRSGAVPGPGSAAEG